MSSMGFPPLQVLDRVQDPMESVIYECGDIEAGNGIRISLMGNTVVIRMESPEYEASTTLEINDLLLAIGKHTRKYAQA